MLRTPPHILVTTPESLYLLLTAERSRQMLKTARVVIVDEIHAVLQSRRGAPRAVARAPRPRLRPQAAAHRPVGDAEADRGSGALPHQEPVPSSTRATSGIDLAVEVPSSPLEAVMSHEVWKEIYDRLVSLIESHRTTLITVNTRRLAERMAHQLSERLGAESSPRTMAASRRKRGSTPNSACATES